MGDASGTAPKMRYGGFLRRFSVAIIDGLVIAIPTSLLSSGSESSNAISLLLLALYRVYFIGSSGKTPGKGVMGLKVIKEDGSSPIGYGAATMRVIGEFASSLILGLGYLLILFDDRKQGLHDKIAGTLVVVSD